VGLAVVTIGNGLGLDLIKQSEFADFSVVRGTNMWHVFSRRDGSGGKSDE
jgi:hypothetical protein